MAIQMIEEANRCLQCKKPMCVTGCPVHTDIPRIISLFKEKRLDEAGAILFDNNPMSLVCSIVCDHADQCTGHCVLNRKGMPIQFGAMIESYISDAWFDKGEVDCAPSKGIAAAVIGSGPAGITVAVLLRRAGYDVTIFEARSEFGGVPRYAIPDFRLPRSIMDRYQKKLEGMGIKIRLNTTIGGALEIADLFRDGYKAVFAGTGVWRPKTLGIKGESLANVHYSMDYLSHTYSYPHLGDRVAIIGMGNAAMDVARVAIRRGSRHVSLYARKHSSMRATNGENVFAEMEGAEFVYGREIVEINEHGPVFRKCILDENDNIVGYEPELEQVEADATIISVSNGPKHKLINTTPGLESTGHGLVVDEHGATTVPGVFAAGDVVTGAKTVVDAVAGAKIAAQAMIEYLESLEQ